MGLEFERHVLSQTKKLSDGSYEKIFTRTRSDETQTFTYNCHLCGVTSLPGERAVQTHIFERKHQQRLLIEYVPNAEQYRIPTAAKPKSELKSEKLMQ